MHKLKAVAMIASFSLFAGQAFALVNGQDASAVFGQLDLSGAPSFTQDTTHLNNWGMNLPNESAVDTVNHRLYVADGDNHRVLVYNLDTNNEFTDFIADKVLGQPDFTSGGPATTQSGMQRPNSVLFDPVRNHLYVACTRRLLVYDVAEITNGENAINVLGQVDFTSSAFGTTSTNFLNVVQGLALDTARGYLFVGDETNNRVLVFDINTLTNGEAAIRVLGQPNFTSSAPALTASGFWTSSLKLDYDPVRKHLFAADSTANRVLVFDVATLTNGESAVHVLGQSNFTSDGQGAGAGGLFGPGGVAYDALGKDLYVADFGNNRVMVFDLETITDGEDAVNVLGVPDFSTVQPFSATRSTFRGAWDVVIDSWTNRLYVTDYDANRVLVFDLRSFVGPDSVRAYPNPFRPGRGHSNVAISQLPSNATVKIYTLRGQLVRSLQAGAAGAVGWDGRNEEGEAVASGVYYGVAEGNGDTKTFKVVVQR